MTEREKSDPGPNAAPVVILVEPQLGENIGTAARAMANFGVKELRLVRPRDGWPNAKADRAASGADFITREAKLFDSLEEALGDLVWAAATTARPRDMMKEVLTPASVAGEMKRLSSEGAGRCGLVFGRERWGLNNDEIALCDVICMAPVNPDFASINIAQAVLLMSYEWFKLVGGKDFLGRRTAFDAQKGEGMAMAAKRSRPATKEELFGFFGHLERELDESGFLWPPEKRPNMVRNIRNMFQRMRPGEQDIRTLRGIVASLSKGRAGKKSGD
jgi:tRNA/rRNA methyltransferase